MSIAAYRTNFSPSGAPSRTTPTLPLPTGGFNFSVPMASTFREITRNLLQGTANFLDDNFLSEDGTLTINTAWQGSSQSMLMVVLVVVIIAILASVVAIRSRIRQQARLLLPGIRASSPKAYIKQETEDHSVSQEDRLDAILAGALIKQEPEETEDGSIYIKKEPGAIKQEPWDLPELEQDDDAHRHISISSTAVTGKHTPSIISISSTESEKKRTPSITSISSTESEKKPTPPVISISSSSSSDGGSYSPPKDAPGELAYVGQGQWQQDGVPVPPPRLLGSGANSSLIAEVLLGRHPKRRGSLPEEIEDATTDHEANSQKSASPPAGVEQPAEAAPTAPKHYKATIETVAKRMAKEHKEREAETARLWQEKRLRLRSWVEETPNPPHDHLDTPRTPPDSGLSTPNDPSPRRESGSSERFDQSEHSVWTPGSWRDKRRK